MLDLSKIALPWIRESRFLETVVDECECKGDGEGDGTRILHLPPSITFSPYLYAMFQIDPVDGRPYLDVAPWIEHYRDVVELFEYFDMKRPILEYLRPDDYRDWCDASQRLDIPLQGLQKFAFGWPSVDVWSAYVESLEISDVKWLRWYHTIRPPFHLTTSIYHLFTPKRATRELIEYLDQNMRPSPDFGPRFCEGLLRYRNREILQVPVYLNRIKATLHQESLFQIAFHRNPDETREEQLAYLRFLVELGFHFHQDSMYITETFKSKNVLVWDFFHQLYPQRFQYNVMQLYDTLQDLTLKSIVSLSDKQEMVSWIRSHYPGWWEELQTTHTQSLFLPIYMADYAGKGQGQRLDDDFIEYLFQETNSLLSSMYYIYHVILQGTPVTEAEMDHFQWKEKCHTIQYPAFRLAIHHNHLPTVQYMVKHHYYSDTEDNKYAILWAVPRRDIFRYLWKHYFRYNHHLFQEDRHHYKNSIYYYLYDAKQLENIHFLMDHKVKPPAEFVRFVKGEKVHLDFYLGHTGEGEGGIEVEKMREEALFVERVLQLL